MTEHQILLVKNSWSYVVVQSEEVGQLFYQRLFEVAPAVRPLFKGDTKEQANLKHRAARTRSLDIPL